MANATSLKKNRRLSVSLFELPQLQIVLLCESFLLLCICIGAEARTVTWGHVNKYALRIYEQDVLLGRDPSNATIDISYPVEGELNVYRITAVHAYDLTSFGASTAVDAETGKASVLAFDDVDAATAELLGGGVGHNFTAVRFHRPIGNSSGSYQGDVRFELVIYGLDL